MMRFRKFWCALFVSYLFICSSIASAEGTFKCTNGNFKANIGDYYGQCVLYVRYETGIISDGCSGNAMTCYDDAKNNNFAVGQEPRVSAIVVFGKNPDSEGDVGHVGIVTGFDDSTITIRDSNWHTPLDGIVREHTMSRSDRKHPILGYIYCDGKTDAPLIPVASAGNVCWEPISVTCEEAHSWYRLMEQDRGMRAGQEICSDVFTQVEQIIQSQTPSQAVPDDPWWKDWWKDVKSFFGNIAEADDIREFIKPRLISIINDKEALVISDSTDSDSSSSSGADPEITIQKSPLDLEPQSLTLYASGTKLRNDRNILPAGSQIEVKLDTEAKGANAKDWMEKGEDSVKVRIQVQIGNQNPTVIFEHGIGAGKLDEGKIHAEKVSYTVPQTGGQPIRFIGEVNVGEHAMETKKNRKDNKTTTDSFQIKDVPDMVPNLTIIGNRITQGATVKKGKSASGSCTVGNVGNAVPATTIHVHHIYDGVARNDDDFKPHHVAPGLTRTVEDKGGIKMNAVGIHSYACCVDPHNANLDSSRGNNCGATFYFQVGK